MNSFEVSLTLENIVRTAVTLYFDRIFRTRSDKRAIFFLRRVKSRGARSNKIDVSTSRFLSLPIQ
jgi:hypothetical protein